MTAQSRPPIDPSITYPAAPLSWRSRYITRPIKEFALRIIDTGFTGVAPLDTHVVIAGFPRGGTTLLQAMCQTCIDDVHGFRSEVRACDVARFTLRSKRYLVSKRPDDVFFFDDVRQVYATKRPKVRFVLLKRDPRAVLTSRHQKSSSGYYVSPARWLSVYEHWKYQQKFSDVCNVKYEELITDPAKVERNLREHIGWQQKLPMTEFYTAMEASFKSEALNGLRPLDATTIDKWRQPEHAPYISYLLREGLPNLPQILIEMHYEASCEWIADYV